MFYLNNYQKFYLDRRSSFRWTLIVPDDPWTKTSRSILGTACSPPALLCPCLRWSLIVRDEPLSEDKPLRTFRELHCSPSVLPSLHPRWTPIVRGQISRDKRFEKYLITILLALTTPFLRWKKTWKWTVILNPELGRLFKIILSRFLRPALHSIELIFELSKLFCFPIRNKSKRFCDIFFVFFINKIFRLEIGPIKFF